MYKSLIILGLAVAFTGCATNSSTKAESPNNIKSEKVAKNDDKKKRIICSKQARVGSHFKRKQCWTAEEYAERQKRDREQIQNIQNNSSSATAPESR